MPRWTSLPSQVCSPWQISCKECARPSWQKSMATNWPQLLKPLACRSALVARTNCSHSSLGKSCRIWLNMLQTFMVGSSLVGGDCPGEHAHLIVPSRA